ADRGDDAYDRTVDSALHEDLQGRSRRLVVAGPELLAFPLLLSERLHDPRRAQRLLRGGHRRTLRRLDFPPSEPDPFLVDEGRKEHERSYGQGDQRELPVEG